MEKDGVGDNGREEVNLLGDKIVGSPGKSKILPVSITCQSGDVERVCPNELFRRRIDEIDEEQKKFDTK